jgi:hypothetical protein
MLASVLAAMVAQAVASQSEPGDPKARNPELFDKLYGEKHVEETAETAAQETPAAAAERTKATRGRRGRRSTILGGIAGSGGTISGSTSGGGTVLGL